MGSESAAGYRFGRFTMNLDRVSLQADGATVDLRPKSFDVLRYLVEHAGRIATKDEIVAAVWPSVIVSDDSLAQCIRDIRKALKDEGDRFIKTVARRGYMFVAEVAPLVETAPIRTKEHVVPASSFWGKAAVAGLSFAVVLVALAGWSGGWFAKEAPLRDARLTIAVLPFANVSENPGEDWLSDGIAEDIMTAVSRFRDLTVIARNSSFRYRGEAANPETIGRELKADFLLQGSIRRSGDRLRITAQLADTRTAAIRWTERFDRTFADVFAIQDEIADAVAARLVAHARESATERVRSARPENLAAYELVLRSRKAYQTFTREGGVDGRALAEQAIAIDPNYADAWVVLARLLIQYYVHPHDESQGTPATLRQARAAAERAVALDPSFSAGHATLGFALMWSKEYDASLEALRRAIDLNPNDAYAINIYAMVLSYSGHYRESIETWERSDRLDPFRSPLALALQAKAHAMLGQFDRAALLARSCAERAPNLQACFIWLAIAAHELGREDEAREAARRLLEISPKFKIGAASRIFPFANEVDAARFVEYMRRAGLPD